MVPRPYASLDAWRRSHALSLRLTALCNTFPRHERFELGSQLRRAARSVPANLAEGHGAYGPSLYHRHVQVALGSLAEVDYYLLCAKDEGYISEEGCEALGMEAWEIRGLLVRLALSLRARAKEK